MKSWSLPFSIFPKRYGFFPYIFLLYVGLPIFYVSQETGFKFWLGYGLIALFLVTYRQLYWETSFTWLLVQMAIILVLTIFYNPYHVFMCFFTANFIGWFEPKRTFNRIYFFFLLFLISIFLISTITFNDGGNYLTFIFYNVPFVIIMAITPFGIRSMNTRMELAKQLDEANEQIKNLVKREERMRIARDLHDTLGHTLSLITLQSQLVQRFAEKNPEKAKESAMEIEKTSRAALRQVRELVTDMRATTIVEELTHIEETFKAAKIKFQRQPDLDFSNIPLLQQNIVSMCLREGATNIVKHSQAKNCSFDFEFIDSQLIVSLKDDGIGFSTEQKIGNGITGMKERLALIDGFLAYESDKGTILQITIPIISTDEKEEMAL